MENFNVLIFGIFIGLAIGYLVRYFHAPLSKEEYEERQIASVKWEIESNARHQNTIKKIKELDEMNKTLNKIIR
ncbi:hypothetical protein PHG11b_41 [Flavobacterium phage 11b]|uniref:hypothetical protein n=1 Tax=Flavobacterium phage 11b TaxID=294631 RepID=UPI0000444147|nr:hypothetical protein PHG11b_41 [Flavobacterium phage 11b]CAH56668.1 hypothetical protein PHG11b_41 [Flavobacterium phage 11b]